jgi:hypothetical protein
MAAPYEVVLVRGKVSYQGSELRKGSRIEVADLSDASNMKQEMLHFAFSGSTDEVHLLDLTRRKLMLISARVNKPGKDLMLATRGRRILRSDFEFQRAFTPVSGVITMVSEDTVICSGLEKFSFNGDVQLAARFIFQGTEVTRIIGYRDSLFVTSQRLFEVEQPEGPLPVNSFEVEGIRLLMINRVTLEETPLPQEFGSFSLYFLDDILEYMASVRYNEIEIDEDAIFNFVFPAFINEKQIQRETGLLTEEEAFNWLRNKIKFICSQPE